MIQQTTLIIILAAWLFVFSAILFIMMGADKGFAKKGARRVRERTLFLTALLGGGLGGVLGMAAFRHKTKHTSFKIGMPLLFILNIAVCVFLVWLNSMLH